MKDTARYLKVVDWDKWQTYRKDRGTPPWIKVYRNLFTNPEWAQLSDAEKGQLVSIWIVAADKRGKITNDAKFLQKICQLDRPPNLNKLTALGFLSPVGRQGDNQMTTTGCHGDAPETETETETLQNKDTVGSKNRMRPDFEKVWKEYPVKHSGKEKAWLKFKGQVQTTEDLVNIKIALTHYKQDVELRRNTFPDLHWQNGATWFNQNWRDYVDWVPPKKTGKAGMQQKILTKAALETQIQEQFRFVEREMKEGTPQTKLPTWFHMALDTYVMQYEDRFREDPLGIIQRNQFNTWKENLNGK